MNEEALGYVACGSTARSLSNLESSNGTLM